KAGLAGTPEVWSPSALLDALHKARRAQSVLVPRSLALAAAAGIVAAGIGLVTCWLAVEAPRFRALVLILVAGAWALPAPIVGVGLKDTIALLLNVCGGAESGKSLYHVGCEEHLQPWREFFAQGLSTALYYGPSSLPALWVDLLRFFPFALAVLWPVVRL